MRMRNMWVALGCMGIALSAQGQEVQSGINGHYYQVLPGTFASNAWDQLQAQAVALGGNLVTIRSAQENQWILDNLGPLTTDNSVFIGFNDIAVEGTFEWVSGEPVTYTNWNGGEPNDAGTSGEDITELNMTTGGWNDNENSQLQDGIMERIVFEFRTNPTGGGFIDEGTNVVLSGDAWGASGPITYQWFKDGTPLGGETGTTLNLPSVTSADDGNYTISASDPSKATILSATVSVKVVAPGSLPAGGTIAIALMVACAALVGALRLRRQSA